MTDSESRPVIPMLAQVPLFASLDKKSLATIAEAGKERNFKSGQSIVAAGETATAFYLILEGAVEVRKSGRVLARLQRGGFFGEMAIFDKQPRSADVFAIEDTTVLLLTSWVFDGIAKTNPKIAWSLAKELVKRLRATNASLSE